MVFQGEVSLFFLSQFEFQKRLFFLSDFLGKQSERKKRQRENKRENQRELTM